MPRICRRYDIGLFPACGRGAGIPYAPGGRARLGEKRLLEVRALTQKKARVELVGEPRSSECPWTRENLRLNRPTRSQPVAVAASRNLVSERGRDKVD